MCNMYKQVLGTSVKKISSSAKDGFVDDFCESVRRFAGAVSRIIIIISQVLCVHCFCAIFCSLTSREEIITEVARKMMCTCLFCYLRPPLLYFMRGFLFVAICLCRLVK